jgi:uncharacterized protein involved in exopolysaccharide biosynthesis
MPGGRTNQVEQMEQIAILDVLRRHVWMIVVLCVVATAAGYGGSFLLPEQYAASALVLVRPQQVIKIDAKTSGKEFLDFPMSQSSSVETPSKTYIEIIKSAELVGKVVHNLGLDKPKEAESRRLSNLVPAFLQPVIDSAKQSLKDVPALLKYGRAIDDDPFTKAVKGVQGNLSLKSLAETYAFEIKYTAKDPQQAADVANATARYFIDLMGEIRQSETRHVRDQLETQLKQSRRQLESARQQLEDYKKAHSVFLYESEYDSKLKVISDLQIELAKAEQALVGSQNTLSKVGLTAKRTLLVRLIAEREAELGPMPKLEHGLSQLAEDVKTAATAYEIVDKEVKEADIKYSYAMPEVRLVSEAAIPHLPSSPARGIIGLASLVSGLVAGIGLALFTEYLNRRVRGIEDVEDFVGIKVLATIPRMSGSRWRRASLL